MSFPKPAPPAKFPPAFPAPLDRQRAMAAARMAETVQPDDSASAVGSTCSWQYAGDASAQVPGHPKAAPPGIRGQGPAYGVPPEVPAKAPSVNSVQTGAKDQDDEDSDQLPEVPADFRWPPPQTAPATQAARDLLGNAQQQAERLAKQKARAKGSRYKVRWGQLQRPGNHAQNYQLPSFIRQIGAAEGERSILVMDNRDKRIQSPFQGWLLDEILLNAQAGINILADRQLARTPKTGYHMNLFYVRTVDNFKFTLVGSMTSYGCVPCAQWDQQAAEVLKHDAFQPFRWPMMSPESATWIDVKIKVEGGLLLRLEFRGYRQTSGFYLDDHLMKALRQVLFVPSCIVTLFQGWRVVATSFEVGGRLYACSDGGQVVALDFPLCHFEIRLTATSSVDAIGVDADRVEFRFRSAGDNLDVSCSQMVASPTWLVVSSVSGRTMADASRWCRDQRARVEGPDQNLQSQLAGIHAHWTASTEAASLDDTGPRVGAVAEDNLHLTCEAPLFRAQKVLVPPDSLAFQQHDAAQEEEAVLLPPVTGGPSVLPASLVSAPLKSLAGPDGPALVMGPHMQTEVSVTEPGQAPEGSSSQQGIFQVQRRSLDARRAENISMAATTPHDFVERVGLCQIKKYDPKAQAGQPRSYGPPPTIDEVEEV